MLTVYYHIAFEPEISTAWIYVVSKAFWDMNHCLDDGGGSDYDRIMAAMAQCDAAELAESMFEVGTMQEADQVIARMRELGFDMQPNEAITNWEG